MSHIARGALGWITKYWRFLRIRKCLRVRCESFLGILRNRLVQSLYNEQYLYIYFKTVVDISKKCHPAFVH